MLGLINRVIIKIMWEGKAGLSYRNVIGQSID